MKSCGQWCNRPEQSIATSTYLEPDQPVRFYSFSSHHYVRCTCEAQYFSIKKTQQERYVLHTGKAGCLEKVIYIYIYTIYMYAYISYKLSVLHLNSTNLLPAIIGLIDVKDIWYLVSYHYDILRIATLYSWTWRAWPNKWKINNPKSWNTRILREKVGPLSGHILLDLGAGVSSFGIGGTNAHTIV